jgi:epoxyqueuosine reductase
MTRGPTPDPTPGATRETIRAEALRLGFASCGFAPAEAPVHADAYLEWLRRGRHGEMAWMAREDAVRRRLDPGEALPGCRTLIVVTWSYAPAPSPARIGDAAERATGAAARSFYVRPDGPPAMDAGEAVIARYALGRDYHDLFEERLGLLADQVRELAPDAACRLYVDYGPVLERDHAQRAGLGWIGKNTLLIDPVRGSYLLLGELLTDLALEPDSPFEADRCGTCARCLEACPTGAIVAPREVDARLCISYLTIELRGPIPVELRPLVGNRVFGCDICQEVCPWNRDPAPGAPGGLELGRPVAPETMRAWAEELLSLDDEEFRGRYGDTALARPGREGLLRNLCVGLGNAGDPESLPFLRCAAAVGAPLVREHAEWAIARVEAEARDG